MCLPVRTSQFIVDFFRTNSIQVAGKLDGNGRPAFVGNIDGSSNRFWIHVKTKSIYVAAGSLTCLWLESIQV